MKIDITREPPADIFRDRTRHITLAIVFLVLSLAGVGLMIYGMVSDTQYSETLELAALALFVAPAVPFSFFGGKVNGYKGLSQEQKQELVTLSRKYPEIAIYCDLVAKADRQPIHAEYEACRDWLDKMGHNP